MYSSYGLEQIHRIYVQSYRKITFGLRSNRVATRVLEQIMVVTYGSTVQILQQRLKIDSLGFHDTCVYTELNLLVLVRFSAILHLK